MENVVLSRRNLVAGMAGMAGMAGLAALGGVGRAFADEVEGDEIEVEDAEADEEDEAEGDEEEAEFSIAGYSQWAINGGNAGNAGANYFLTGEENRPTDEELTTMFQAANSYFQCHGLTGAHFVIVKDPDEQATIMGPMLFGNDATGTVTILCFADGLSDQDIHTETYYPGAQEEDPEYWQMPYALVELGWAMGYLNLAVREFGYRMHTYGALSLPNAVTGEVSLYDTAGSFEYINRGMWDADKYLVSADEETAFTHYTMVLGREIECAGNLTLVCACLIGRIDEGEDAEEEAEEVEGAEEETTETEVAVSYTAGTYSASATGIGEVTVTMTFDEDSITAVEVDASNETASIGGAAADTLAEQVLEAQSSDIDGVSGATLTSTAVRNAAADCIAQASGSEEAATVDAVSGATASYSYKTNIRNNFNFWD